MKKQYIISIMFVAIVLLGLSMASETSAQRKVRPFVVDLQPLNNSGVSGTAHLELDREQGQLTVVIEATGLEADRTHAQHIHGFSGDEPENSTCPTLAADADGDGLVSVGEGLPNYGPVLLALQPFTTAPGGVIDFMATYSDLSNLDPVNALQNRSIVIHGLSVDGNYIGSLPVACGQIRPEPRGPKSK
jgi:hypothetical protein